MSGFIILNPKQELFLPNEQMAIGEVLTHFVHKQRKNETVSPDTRFHYSPNEKNGPANPKATVLLGKPVYGTVILSKNGGRFTDEEAKKKIAWLKTIQ